ncbi:glycosyltransferase family A protein [Clostridium sp. DJ247]|uniref:glycosyltransferase family A protein n=1 Tax=Clostridium sp. DJ247 TaxID=2726188 RepID=UPI00162821E6|nr:glycosyltransferase family 2 protein [Clostridium sp. DJ247]MBC2580168.1 glycosyltransferase family 2 protein [Clostridium sp. DJ247]
MKASVIIPSYNSKERLYYNLISLNNQDCDFDIFEVIVVDNGSSDNTLEMLKNFKPKFHLKFVRLENNKGIARGRNTGIKKAIGDILIFHDSDMIAPRDFITRHLANHKEKNVVVCGIPWKRIFTFYYKEFGGDYEKYLDKTVPKLEDKSNKLSKYSLISIDSIINGSYIQHSFDLDTDFMRILMGILEQHNGKLDDYTLPWRFFFTNNASVERNRVIEVGMFDENIVAYGFEDYDLGIRLYKSGNKFIFDKNILSVHQEHPTNSNTAAMYENINYICDKYNNIYFLDVILVCIYYRTSINSFNLNELVKDINNMISLSYFKPLLDIFLELLQTCRRRFFDEGVKNMRQVMPNTDIDVEKITMEVIILRDVFGIKYFTEAMLALIREIYNVYY